MLDRHFRWCDLLIITTVFMNTSVKSVLVKVPGRACTFKDGNQIYDLSELAARKHWIYTENHSLNSGEKSIFFASICHAIQGFSSCSADDGICFFKGKESESPRTYLSGGKYQDSVIPTIYEEGHMKITYKGGSNCSYSMFSPVDARTFNTDIYLQCPTGDEAESPGPTLITSTHCSYIFVWVTKSACPQKLEVQEDPCIVRSSQNDHLINLHNLMSKNFYSVRQNQTKYEINLCGPIQGGSCKEAGTAICDTNNKKSLASDTDKSVSWDNDRGMLVMKFRGNTNIDIQLKCDREAFTPKIYYSSLKNESHSLDHQFIAHTAVVCPPQTSECVIEDTKQNVYDLRSLHKSSGNWEVLGASDHGKSKLYHLNICGPLNKDKNAQCPPGPLGACRTSISAGGAQNIGYITSNPVVKEDGTILIVYTGGESCRANVKSSSSRITLTCSEIEHYPILVEITDSCEHIFDWHTPAACPRNVVTGKDCKVTDPQMGWTFNLNHLTKPGSDYEVKYRYNIYRINPCKPLNQPCRESNSAMCHSEVSGGKSPGKLVFNDGTLLMKYTNGSTCQQNQTYSTQILFICDQNRTADVGVQYLPIREDMCTYNFIWRTVHACPSFTTVKCFVSDQSGYYDLSPLSNSAANEIYITSNHSKRYVLNVCRSVVHSKENRCPYHSGACLFDSDLTKPTLNLGNVYSAPFVKDGNLQIWYKNGDICNETHTYETIIYFKCSQEPETYPVLIQDFNCKVVFEWNTIHACPIKRVPEKVNTGTCSAENSLSGFVYDMSELSSSTPSKLHITSNTYILFNVCGEVSEPGCASLHAGACFVNLKDGKKTYTSAGIKNRDLKFQTWNPFLEYTGGDLCDNGMSRSTRISFVCSDNSTLAGPVFIDYELSSCTIFINWYTERACDRKIQCFADTWGRKVDLAPFSKFFSNYEVQDPSNDDVKYFLNICRPLNPISGTNCHAGSSACRVEQTTDGKKISSLGHALLNPVITSSNKTELMYAYGSSCSQKEDGPKFSSRVIFICDQNAGVGEPTFKKQTHDCQVQFEWRSSLVCNTPEHVETTNDCHIYFEEAKANIDLTPLRKPGGYEVQFGSKTFLVNVCGSVCGKSGVCTKGNENYGLSSNSKLEWKEGGLLLTYFSGDPCTPSLTQHKTSLIFFPCHMSAGYGKPMTSASMNNFDCMGIFNWPTNITCLESFYANKSVPTIRPPIRTTTTFLPGATSTPVPRGTSEQVLPESHHTSAIVAILVLVVTALVVAWIMTRTTQGRQFVTRVKGIFSKKGDEAIILDDQYA